MKALKYVLCLASAMTLLSSCLFQEDEKFSESAGLRGQNYVNSIKEVLYTPEHGWVMQYFANNQEFFETYDEIDKDFIRYYTKGYNIYCRFFADETVILSSDHEWLRNNPGTFQSDTSLYTLNEQDGPVLSFDTWNDILSVFSDPACPTHPDYEKYGDNGLDGVGLMGDNEFVVTRVSADEILMRGERHDGIVRLLRCPCPIDEYRQKVAAAATELVTSRCPNFVICSTYRDLTDSIFCYDLKTSVMNFSYIPSADGVIKGQPFIMTIDGMRFQRSTPLDFYVVREDGDTVRWSYNVQNFAFDEAHSCLKSDEESVVLIPDWKAYVRSRFSGSRVTFDNTASCAAFNTLYNKIEQGVAALKGSTTAEGTTFTSASLTKLSWGKTSEASPSKSVNGLAFSAAINLSYKVGSKTQTSKMRPVYGFEARFIDNMSVDNTFTIEVDETNYSDFLTGFFSSQMADYVAMANMLKGTYTIKPDDYFNPKEITLTKVDDPSFFLVISL